MLLTQEQMADLEKGEPLRVTIGETACVILREDVYREETDDSPWTGEEMDRLASEAADLIQDDLDEPL
jgi:hypothetical protein